MISRRHLLVVPAALSAGDPVFARDEYPRKFVRMVVPFAAGGPADLVGRVLAEGMGADLAQAVVVENRSGAGAVAGTEVVAKAAPDGYTILLATIAHAISPSLFKSLPFDPVRDFTPVGLVGRTPLVLAVRPSLGVHTVAELVGLMNGSPGKLSYGSSGKGAADHLAGALFASSAGVSGLHVPYRGAAPAILDLLAGRLDFIITTGFALMPYIRSAALVPLAVTATERVPQFPAVPTMAEAGIPNMEVSLWYCVLAPAGTPPAIVGKLSSAVRATVATRAVTAKFRDLGIETAKDSSPEDLSRLLASEIRRWSQVLQSAGVEKQ